VVGTDPAPEQEDDMETQNDWSAVALMCEAAKGIAFDTCHKIYILLDSKQMEKMHGHGYDPLISSEKMTPEEMYDQIRKWYAASCPLRFVSAVRTVESNPNAGFIDLIPQA
jgi:hypothetical protein